MKDRETKTNRAERQKTNKLKDQETKRQSLEREREREKNKYWRLRGGFVDKISIPYCFLFDPTKAEEREFAEFIKKEFETGLLRKKIRQQYF